MSVKTILEQFAKRERAPLGEQGLSRAVINRLRKHAVTHRLFFVAYFIFLILVGGFGVFGIAWFFNDPENMTVIGSAMGISIGGVLVLMQRSLKEWNYSVILIHIMEDATEAQVSTLIDKMIKKF